MQSSTEHFDYEIIVGDDGSTDLSTVEKNEQINTLTHCHYICRTENTGRAYIRNWLVDQTQFNYLLLIDSDAAICKRDFIQSYWNARNEADALCGGIQNPQTPCPKGCELRYKYEHQAEIQRKSKNLNENPFFRLSTFNLFLNKKRIGNIRFDVRCKEYGYEDALLGLTLQEKGFTVKHIDNPLIHTGIDSNVSFLSKTEASIRTLSRLKGIMQEHAGTSRAHRKLQKLHLTALFRFCFKISRNAILHNLKSSHPSLFFFQLYKLGYYSELNH